MRLKPKLCLGIETSCDETALALIDSGQVVESVLASQVDLHAKFGGVVPELASREHYRWLGLLFDDLILRTKLNPQDLDLIAVTRGPGLLGALLVGIGFAKGLALGLNKPIIGINHLHAHLLVVGEALVYPALGLLVSGGHTHIYYMLGPNELILLGKTIDDAAGEACDKFAKMLGLPYPGGAVLDACAKVGQADAKLFPRPYMRNDNLDFSFSGLKTAGLTYVQSHAHLIAEGKAYREHKTPVSAEFNNTCASYLLAVADTLQLKLHRAYLQLQTQGKEVLSLVVAGGVAANSKVRASMQSFAEEKSIPLLLPSMDLCTDNGVMVAYAGYLLGQLGLEHDLDFRAIPRGQKIPEDWRPKTL